MGAIESTINPTIPLYDVHTELADKHHLPIMHYLHAASPAHVHPSSSRPSGNSLGGELQPSNHANNLLVFVCERVEGSVCEGKQWMCLQNKKMVECGLGSNRLEAN